LSINYLCEIYDDSLYDTLSWIWDIYQILPKQTIHFLWIPSRKGNFHEKGNWKIWIVTPNSLQIEGSKWILLAFSMPVDNTKVKSLEKWIKAMKRGKLHSLFMLSCSLLLSAYNIACTFSNSINVVILRLILFFFGGQLLIHLR